MDKRDAQKFASILQANLSGYAGDRVNLPSEVKRWWWDALEPYSIEEIEQAFLAHARRSSAKPKPADIIEIINQQDGRPTADEAWPIALQAASERATVIWTDEIEKAWFHCYPVFEQGDEVGARMAFRQFYDRLVDKARVAGIRPKWKASLGHDPEERKEKLLEAGRKGLIDRQKISALLPHNGPVSGENGEPALLGYGGGKNTLTDEMRANLGKIREMIKIKK